MPAATVLPRAPLALALRLRLRRLDFVGAVDHRLQFAGFPKRGAGAGLTLRLGDETPTAEKLAELDDATDNDPDSPAFFLLAVAGGEGGVVIASYCFSWELGVFACVPDGWAP